MKHLDPLTGLRGVAAYCVLVAHSISTAYFFGGANVFQPFAGRLAYFGMSLFFVLSGFVIAYNYVPVLARHGMLAGSYRFLVARFARLYPLYALVIVFSLEGIPSERFSSTPWAFETYLTLTQSWFNLQQVTFEPTWSISTEWFFYFAFLVLVPLLVRIRHPRIALAAFIVLSIAVLPRAIHLQSSFEWVTGNWAGYYSPYVRVFEFIAGMLCAAVFRSFHDVPRRPGLAAWIVLLACLAWCAAVVWIDPATVRSNRYRMLVPNFAFAPAIAVLLLHCCIYRTFVSRLMSSRPLMFMGTISYSVYLLQFWVLTALGGSFVLKAAPTILSTDPLIKILAVATLTTMIAYGSYRLFEDPARVWIRNLLIGRPATPEQADSRAPADRPMTAAST